MATEFIQLQRALYTDLSVQYGRLEELHSRRSAFVRTYVCLTVYTPVVGAAGFGTSSRGSFSLL